MRPTIAAVMCTLAFAAACSRAPQAPKAHSTATLVLEQSSAQPGTQIRVGIQFVIDKDWHIYWKNPGDSGEPPQVHWQPAAGATPGALQWPTPVRLHTGAGTDYGYEGNVILLSTLNIPATAPTGTELPIAGDLRWLVCHDVCIPQRAELKATVRISNAATVDQRAQALLTAAAERIPRSVPDGLHLTASSERDTLRLNFTPGGNLASAMFFPAEEEQIENAAPQVLANAGSIYHLELKKSDHLQRDPEHLQGVLVLNGQDGYQVDVPLRSTVAHKEKKQ